MPATTLNINVDIPKGRINMEKLQQQVTLYAQFVINNIAQKQVKQKNGIKHFSALKGVLKNDSRMTDTQLLDEYLSEKYKI